MNPGSSEISLKVASVKESIRFYERLGFSIAEGDSDHGWASLQNGETRIGLYEGMIEENSITFFGRDVEAIAKHLEREGETMASGPEVEPDGTIGATIRDPDGNLIYFHN